MKRSPAQGSGDDKTIWGCEWSWKDQPRRTMGKAVLFDRVIGNGMLGFSRVDQLSISKADCRKMLKQGIRWFWGVFDDSDA